MLAFLSSNIVDLLAEPAASQGRKPPRQRLSARPRRPTVDGYAEARRWRGRSRGHGWAILTPEAADREMVG